MTTTHADYTLLDYRCDPRVQEGPGGENTFVAVDNDGDTWQLWISPSDATDAMPNPWAVRDVVGHFIDVYASAEEALHSVLGDPIPSAYIHDTRVQPVDKNGQPIAWTDDPGFFQLNGDDSDAYFVHIGGAPYWIARPVGRMSTTWDLLDEALFECLGEPDRPYNYAG